MTAYEVLRYRPEFRPGLLALRQHLFTRDEALNEAYFRGKHEENP